jgi:orotate phosphoribosyltransferase
VNPTQVLKVADHLGVNPSHANSIDQIHRIVEEARALLQGHFELQERRHSDYFVRFKQIGRERSLVERAAQFLVSGAEWMKSATRVVGAESAGFYLAHALGRKLEIETAIATIDQRRRPTKELRTGTVDPDSRVVIATDLVTTGSSLRTLIELVEGRGASVCGVAVFGLLDPIEYTKVLNERKLPGNWLVQSMWRTWDGPATCPHCARHDDAIPALELN